MNDLVFVMYNLKLRERQRQRQCVIEEIPFENLPSDDEWVTERENPTLPRENSWLRVLDDNPKCDTSDEEGNEDDEIEILTRNVQRVCKFLSFFQFKYKVYPFFCFYSFIFQVLLFLVTFIIIVCLFR